MKSNVNESNISNNDDQNNKSNKPQVSLMDDIIENNGFGLITLKIFLIPFIFHLIEGVHLNMFAALIIPMKEYYKFTSFQEKFIPGFFFIGSAGGSLLLGSLTSIFDRIKLLKFWGMIIFIFNFLLIFSNNSNLFTLSRIFIGFAIGVSMPITLNLLTEYSPVKNRATIFMCGILGFSFGTLFQLFVILKVMPEFESNKMPIVYLWTFIPSIIYLIYIMIFAEDSPRSLLVKGRIDEGLSIIERMNGHPLTHDQKKQIIESININSTSISIKSSYTELFSPNFVRLTILLILIGIIRGFHYYGILTVSSLTLKQDVTNTIESNYNVIMNEIYINLIIFPCYLLGGPISEIKFFGRKYAMLIAFFISFLCLIGACLIPNLFSVYIGTSILASNIGSGISSNYTSEAFPTNVRDSAYGFIFFFIRSAAVLSNFIYLGLNDYGVWRPYYFDILMLSLACLFIYLLPYETCGKTLDDMNMKNNFEIKYESKFDKVIGDEEKNLLEKENN